MKASTVTGKLVVCFIMECILHFNSGSRNIGTEQPIGYWVVAKTKLEERHYMLITLLTQELCQYCGLRQLDGEGAIYEPQTKKAKSINCTICQYTPYRPMVALCCGAMEQEASERDTDIHVHAERGADEQDTS